MSEKPLKITALSIEELSRILSNACGKKITYQQVRDVADKAGILNGDRVNLIEYTAFLAKEVSGGKD